ncbi:hypothetical protein [Algoriphagus boritolerans]|uniref:hypothetical protein n=1 Tax=Algoriphagus boritolerans TaxID=308111 RepID=UPI000AA26B3B
MSNIVDELQEGLKLLKLEWAEDLAQYKKKFLNTTLAEKKKSRNYLASDPAEKKAKLAWVSGFWWRLSDLIPAILPHFPQVNR